MIKQRCNNQRPTVQENTHYPPAFSAPPYRTRNRRSFDVQRLIGLSLRLATNRQQPPRCDSNRHPQSLCPRRVIHACVLPLPAAPFTVFEALFYPGPQTVPAGIGAFRRQIGQHQPRVLVFFAPVAQQRAVQLAFLALKCDSPSLPTSALGRHPVGKRLSSDTSLRDETCLGCSRAGTDAISVRRWLQITTSRISHDPPTQ
jgi:hypothetical protein